MNNDAYCRDTLIDSLRAIALAGVIVMNLMTFSGLAYLTPEMRAEMLGVADQLLWALLRIFVDDKALSAFSFMFGFSFSLILRKALSAQDAATRFLRRLLVLFLIGLFNALFLFWADILMSYALLGLILPLAARLPNSGIAGLAIALLLVGPVVVASGGYGIPAPVPMGHVESLEAYASPQFADMIRQNWHMLVNASEGADGTLVLRFFQLAGLFLLGLAAGRSGVLMALSSDRERLLRLGLAAMLAGLVMALAARYLVEPAGVWVMLNLESPVMALGYLMLIAGALASPQAGWLRRFLAPLGRMTLTGYLMTAICGQMLFYGWGLGLIGQVGTLAVLGIAAAIYLVLILFARIWLRLFSIGPWEWLWRYLTNLHPMAYAARGIAR
ncbi:DUF418 domain-containing protein [Natronohydrobacter thiooxidans]|uniref:DUF418 domain-containing protein n=1 Tax=Natronohydrobacter thiooxidans TaxID=87172 RepID=UPI0008FF3DB7|nr:DUF418 domain-containing protein [Natronohydrobacter thiooxidans]